MLFREGLAIVGQKIRRRGGAWLTSNFDTSSSSMRDMTIPAMETTADAKLRKMEIL
jgi:hypothetical protein